MFDDINGKDALNMIRAAGERNKQKLAGLTEPNDPAASLTWNTLMVPVGGERVPVRFRNDTPEDPSCVEFAPLPPAVADYYEIREVLCPVLILKTAPPSAGDKRMKERDECKSFLAYGRGYDEGFINAIELFQRLPWWKRLRHWLLGKKLMANDLAR